MNDFELYECFSFHLLSLILIHNRLYYFLQEHEILYQNQFVFKNNNSTVLALAQISDDSGDQGNHCQWEIWLWHFC